jgi:hypothetical protein
VYVVVVMVLLVFVLEFSCLCDFVGCSCGLIVFHVYVAVVVVVL